jgi:hypothetical protein
MALTHLAGRDLRGPPVPIRVLLHNDVSFEPEDIEKLTAAFELALSKLELPDRQDPLAVVLAKFIIELAKEGERDPHKLCDRALAILCKSFSASRVGALKHRARVKS